MASRFSPVGRENFNVSLPIGSVKLFATELFAAKFELFLLFVQKILNSAVRGKMAPSWKKVEVLEAKMIRRKERNFIPVLGITASSLLQRAGTEQVRQIFQLSTASHTHAAVEMQWRERCFQLS